MKASIPASGAGPESVRRPVIKQLGRRDYRPVWEAMRRFTHERDAHTPDELWVVEHAPVFTLGQAGKPEHLLAPGDIPVERVDRGGQVTYHGPGQVVIYLLLDLRRRHLGVRTLVTLMEQSVIEVLAAEGIVAQARSDAPGVYVDGAKIAALGLRVRHGRCYHGLSFNVEADLRAFARINPCGYAGLPVVNSRDLGSAADSAQMAERLCARLLANLG